MGWGEGFFEGREGGVGFAGEDGPGVAAGAAVAGFDYEEQAIQAADDAGGFGGWVGGEVGEFVWIILLSISD